MRKTRPHRRVKSDPGLQAAIIAAKGVTRLAEMLGVKHPSISVWKRCPAERVPAVERATGVPRHVLRPDLYETPQRERSA